MRTGTASAKLEVRKALTSDTFKDRVRIPLAFRQGIPESTICRISTANSSRLVELRGKKGVGDAAIFMDARTRKAFNLKVGLTADFKIKPVGWLGELKWASKNADPGLRIAAQLGLISLVLGIISIIVSIAALPWPVLLKLLR